MEVVKMPLENLKEIRKKSITVGFLFEACHVQFKLKKMNGEVGFDNLITDKNLHRPGLALAGYVGLFTYDRVQIFGNTEVKYINELGIEERIKAMNIICQFSIPCIIVTHDNEIDDALLGIAAKNNVPVFQTPIATTKFVYLISDFLDDQFASQTVVHGAFIDVYGIGLLFVGRAGIGKSEIALDLVERGHRLVADDVVMITQKGEGILMGSGTELAKHFMEIRGLGLIDVRSMFGIRAIRFQKRIEVVIELHEWRRDEDYTRTGLDEDTVSILGVEVPIIQLPIFPGKNVTVITEVIALNHLLKRYGYDSAQELTKRLDAVISEKSKKSADRAIKYFEHDFE
jgi:HPr kinase/phosphorylase